MKKIPKELIGATAVPLILSILKQGDTYGYEIIKKVKTLSAERIQWKEGSLYPVLKRLEAKKLIKSYWDVKSEPRPRKYYTLNKLGEEALITEQEKWTFMNDLFARLWNPQIS